MSDLPPVPAPAPLAAFGASIAPGFPAQNQPPPPGSIPRGRPAEDPEEQLRRIEKHAQRTTLKSSLPKRATEQKVLIYKDTKGTGRIAPASRPVLTVLLSELTKVKEDNKDIDETDAQQQYLEQKLIGRFGRDRVDEMAPFICRVVDAQGNRIPEIADWALLDDAIDEDGDIDPEEDPEGDGYVEDDRQPRGRAHEGEPPRTQALDVQQYDALAAANRREGENAMTPILAMMQQQAQAAAAAQAQQMQMMVAMLQNNQQQAQAAAAGSGGTMAAVLTALAPVLAQILKPKEDNTEKLLAILLPVLAGKGDSSAETMRMIPQILGEVSKQQMSLMGASAQQTVHLQGEANKQIVSSMIATMKDIQKEGHAPAAESEGGGMFENLAKLAGPVIGAMMAPKPQQEVPALEAPRLPAPPQAPRPRPAVAKQPAPPSAPPQTQAQAQAPQVPAAPSPTPAPQQAPAQPAVQANPADLAEKKIISCFNAVLSWQQGKYPPSDKTKVLRYVRDNATPQLLAAIRSDNFDQVVAVGQEPVLKTPHLVAWISQEENQTYLQEFLAEVRNLDLRLKAEAEAAAALAEKPVEVKPKPGIPVHKGKKAPPPPVVKPADAAPAEAKPADAAKPAEPAPVDPPKAG